jgi:hypothetical protein
MYGSQPSDARNAGGLMDEGDAMSNIQDEAYTELCEENGRLKGEQEALSKHFEILKASCDGKDAQIERLKALLDIAADALATNSIRQSWSQSIIVELRKAAE